MHCPFPISDLILELVVLLGEDLFYYPGAMAEDFLQLPPHNHLLRNVAEEVEREGVVDFIIDERPGISLRESVRVMPEGIGTFHLLINESAQGLILADEALPSCSHAHDAYGIVNDGTLLHHNRGGGHDAEPEPRRGDHGEVLGPGKEFKNVAEGATDKLLSMESEDFHGFSARPGCWRYTL